MIKFKFSNIRSNNPIGKIIRAPLYLLPKTTILPVIQGPGKGIKWIVGSGVHGLWLGSYEADKQQLISKLPLEATTVLDIGANVGFFSILLSRLVGAKGKVIAFEPLPRNIDFIEQHIRLNQIENIQIYSAALSNKSGVMKFSLSDYHEQGRLDENGDLEVSVTTLDSLKDITNSVSFVKIDVEGAEASVLRGGKNFFKYHRPTILLATHGNNYANECEEILTTYDYSMTLVSKDLYGLECDEWLVEPKEK